jgi:uroporphyrinogen III methyltransferase / synthase
MAATGKVWLVGAGPGDPGLITVKGLQLLAQADVVLYDALSHPALLAHAAPGAELRDVGKRGGKLSPDQIWITDQLIELALAGKRVVRLKGGDSYLFARGAEEAEALVAAGVEFEVIPGLSSPVGTSTYAGIPLTHRDLSSSVTFITGSDKAGEEWSDDAWRKLATATDTICILMGMRRIAEITRAIIAGGRAPSTPAAVVQWGARPQQRVVTATLERIAHVAREAGLGNPAVIIIGEVVSMRETLNWFEKKPLFGQRILLPRAEHQAAETAAQIRDFGAEPVLFPVLEMVEPEDRAALPAAVAELSSYDWVLFTSANGVERFWAELDRQHKDARAFASAKVGVIGPKTAQALSAHGVRADVCAKEFVGESLARAIQTAGGGKRVLLPRAQRAREALPELLRGSGYQVTVVPAYETRSIAPARAEELKRLLADGEVDTVLFTSSSTVESVCDALGSEAARLLSRVQLASIGPVTSATAAGLGLEMDVTAEVYTVPGLLQALATARALRK